MLKGKRFHHTGSDASGGSVFSECMTGKPLDDGATIVRVEKAKPGMPVPLGKGICHVKPIEGDDEHVEIEEVEVTPNRRGPAMVSSKEYRSGWDRVFGSNGIN
jgi:hypothetical protein